MNKAMAVLFAGILFSVGVAQTTFGDASTNAGKLIFTEIVFRSANDWVELYVVDGDVDWSGYRIYEGGQLRKTISLELGQALATGDYIVFHEEDGEDETSDKGSNGYWDIYGLTGLYATDLILQIKNPSGSTDRVDVVIYSDDSGTFSSSGLEANDAVNDGMWNAYDFSTGDAGAWTDSDDVSSTESLARDFDAGAYVDNNAASDWYKETDPTYGGENVPTAVLLVSFSARSLAENIALEWETATEVNSLGFNLFRAGSAGGQKLSLNHTLIPSESPGSPIGARYEFVDETVEPGTIYYYWLESVGSSGSATRFGPVSTTASATWPTFTFYLPLAFR